jgi:two-component system chemotaxis sensor kinase CheA
LSTFDPEILQDFLTESGELLDALEADLVVLEKDPRDAEMLNKVFRALHTIKGSASFLALTNLVRIAHASESALNAARNSVVVVDRTLMDLLLQAVDILKTQMGQIREGQPLVEPPPALVAELAAIGEGKRAHSPAAVASASAEKPAPAATPRHDGWSVAPLSLGEGKADLIDFLVADVDETLAKIEAQLSALTGGADAPSVGQNLADLSEALRKSVEFFDFSTMSQLAGGLCKASAAVEELAADHAAKAVPRFREALALLQQQSQGLKSKEVRSRDVSGVVARLEHLHDVEQDAPNTGSNTAPAATPVAASPSEPARGATPELKPQGAAPSGAGAKADDEKKAAAGVESTIRVEVGRLESLMNLVGELVLQKNRISAIARRLGLDTSESPEDQEALMLAAGGLDRITGDIQTAVMRTRMQPLDKLFGKYPRLIRDLASKTGKKMRLVIEGGETEVDKSVIEELGDPLVHLLRNSADHGLEGPEERLKTGKPEEGTITLRASHEGSHVRIVIIDDGRGLSRERIGKKAVERGLCTPEELAQMPDKDVWKFIFGAGFSTADKVSDLSGRGVGMDVVRTNISKIKGEIELSSEIFRGTTISITIPLTVAILPAMMVAVAKEIYAIPLGNILEIVKPAPEQIATIGEHPVLRLREDVLPLVNAVDAFEQPGEPKADTPFAVVLSNGDRRVGLLVTRLIGQQEIVIKPLDTLVEKGEGGAVSGATVRDDGGVSLIVDVAALIRQAEKAPARAG